MHGLERGCVDAIKHVTLVGRDRNYIDETQFTKRLVGKQVEISCQHNNRIIVSGRDEIKSGGDMEKQMLCGVNGFGG